MTALHGERGFTLLELLVALALFALLATAALSGLRTGVRAWDAGRAHTEALSSRGAVLAFLQSRLSQAYPLMLPGDPAVPRILFEGGPDVLVFAAQLPAYRGLGGLRRFEMRLAGGDGRSLVLRDETVLAGAAVAEPEGGGMVLFDRVAKLEIAYFGMRQPGETARWHDTWARMPHLPELVRLRVAREEDASPVELTVALRIDVDGQCLFSIALWRCERR